MFKLCLHIMRFVDLMHLKNAKEVSGNVPPCCWYILIINICVHFKGLFGHQESLIRPSVTVSLPVNRNVVSYHDITAIVTTFYYFRLHIYKVNVDHVDAEKRAVYIWTLTIWLLAISGIFETNRRNVIYEVIALILLVLRNDVCKPRALIPEPLEHNFGFFRSIIRQFTVMKFIQLLKKNHMDN